MIEEGLILSSVNSALHSVQDGNWAEALRVLEQIPTEGLGSAEVQEVFGIAFVGIGDLPSAQLFLRRALQSDPGRYRARLFLAETLEEHPLAAHHSHWAIADAQKSGRWKSEASTDHWELKWVRRAIVRAREDQRRRLHAAAHQAQGDDISTRISGFIESLILGQLQNPADPRQIPKTHFIPGLPAVPWISRDQIPWTRTLEDAFPVIAAECLSVLREGHALEPFLKFSNKEQVGRYLDGRDGEPRWDAFFFYRHGKRYNENFAKCPATGRIIDSLPLFKLDGIAPEICFSVLSPGTHILPHRGDSNARVVIHLPLIVPFNCALKVAGEERTWKPGEILAFDDSYEHEAWNNSDSLRVVLILDGWNPALSEGERRGFIGVLAGLRELGIERDRNRNSLSVMSMAAEVSNRQKSDDAWQRYWKQPVLHSFPGSFTSNYDGEVASFWKRGFEALTGLDRVLDVGTGNGAIPKLMVELIPASRLPFIDAIDGVPLSREQLNSIQIASGGRVSFHAPIKMESMPFADAAFNLVTSSFAIEYSNFDLSLKEVFRVTRPFARIEWIMHHTKSLPVSAARSDMEICNWLLKDSDLFGALDEVLPVMTAAARVRAAGGVLNDPLALKARQRYNDAQRRLSGRRQQERGQPLIEQSAARAAALLRSATLSLPTARSQLTDFRHDLEANLVRLNDMLAHALDDRAVDALKIRLESAGFGQLKLDVVRLRGTIFGWALSAQRMG